ncbi:MAG: hypothetical protein F6K28_29340, partial [Microcoleus sp. SIO2G3]|nr:hypothetical protein [Microcoleus sp. SIO2G3]
MSRKASGFWYHIRLLVKSVPLRAYHRVLGLILLALLTLITTLCVPTLATQRVEGSSEALTQTSNAHSLLQQGIELYDAEQFSEAIEVWQQATSAFLSQGDSLNQALVLRYLSLAYQHLGQWEEAQRAIASSFELLDNQRNTANTQAYLDVFAKALNTQGRLQATQAQWSEALSTWKKAAVTYKEAGNDTGVIGSLINQAQALQALGLSSQAEAELLHVEQILLQQLDPELTTIGLQNLGEALRRVGNLSKSQEVLQKSLAVAKEFQLSRAESYALLELGNTERALAHRAIAIGKQDDEKQHTEAAIAFYQQAANSPTLRVQAQLNLLSLLVLENPSEAEKLASVIQPSLVNLPPSRTNIYAQLNLAQSLTKLGSREELEVEQSSPRHQYPASSIAQILATAVQQARSLKDRVAESYALGQLGGLYELTEQMSAAYDLTQQALLLAEEIQAPDIRYRWEWQLGRLWEKQGDIKKAIAAYEEAVATLSSVRNDLLTINSEVQFSFRDNVEPVHRKLVDLLLRTVGSNSTQNLQRATEVIDSLQLAELENFLSCNLSQAVQLNQDIDKIDENAALIYPIVLEDRMEVIVKLPGQSLRRFVT